MNRHVNSIAGRLSLRPPQRKSLEILDRLTEIVPPKKSADSQAALAAVMAEFPAVTDFERDFPSLCFALATGVGKTRLMGAFIAYLHLAHRLNNFFVLAPSLTIYNKLVADFTPNTPKYVFKGIAEFATDAPVVITGDNYEGGGGITSGRLPGFEHNVVINIFNISKINSEVRGGKSPRIKRLAEYIGQSYFAYLAGLEDLVLLMDESHHYRASAGARAINELKPVLGLELTATPQVEAGGRSAPFKNVVFEYPLAQALADGFVKEPAVATRKNFNPAGMSAEQLEKIKLEDGVRLHEIVKVELETYARNTGRPIVKPFVLVIARDTTHAAALLQAVEDNAFFDGRYKGKVIQVDVTTTTGAENDKNLDRLLNVERADEPTEIVIHVNMLKEGWDVTNLYTIIPLRAASSKTLVEQSIGRGLRLPYGTRTGVPDVDRLNIVAHDRFQEIVDEANKPGSLLKVQTRYIDAPQAADRPVMVVAPSRAAARLGLVHPPANATVVSGAAAVFSSQEEKKAAAIAAAVIEKLGNEPSVLSATSALHDPEVQSMIAARVQEEYRVAQPQLPGIAQPDMKGIVATVSDIIAKETIDVPRIVVVPKGDVQAGFDAFKLDLTNLRYQPPSDELWQQVLRTGAGRAISLSPVDLKEDRLENYVVAGLVDFNDVSYDEQADLLYDLASQVVGHLQSYLPREDAEKVLRVHEKQIAQLVHAQMQDHHWVKATGYETKTTSGFALLKESNLMVMEKDGVLDFHQPPADKSNMGRYVFGGFKRCLYDALKFDSDAERRLAVILDRDSEKWFRPVRGQFQLYYKHGAIEGQYQPDFIAETEGRIYMLEPKAANEMADPEVLAKRDAGVTYCKQATEHNGGLAKQPWSYLLIPHDQIAENMTLEGLAGQFTVE